MELLRNFNQLTKNDAIIAGGKGASLGEMTQANIPVPDGYVALSTAFDHFLNETDLALEIDSILKTVDHKEMHTVESASEKIQGLIKNVPMPEIISEEIIKHFKNLDTGYVAVRSSATAEDGQEHAWAGQLDSFLNTTEKDLLEKVQCCWASLFTPRAIFYRFEKGLHTTQISVAVVVQKMVNSEISGIAFSVHPVTEDRNQLIIEAGFGLGEAIVSGQITPDSYVVEKEPRNIIDINVSNQGRGLYRVENGGNEWLDIEESKASSQVLNETQILELSEIILGIENHYGFPCDIEWAFERGRFFIVQSRPITTLLKSGTVSRENIFTRWIVQNKLDFLYKANYDLFTIDLYYQTSLLNNSFVGSQDTDYVILSEKGEAAAYYPVKQEDESKLFNEKLLKEVFERSESAKIKYQTFYQRYITAATNGVNLAEFFDEYCSLYIDLVACFRTTRPVYVDSLVESLKEKLFTAGAEQETLSCLLISENDDDIRLEQADWTSLLKNGSTSPDDFKKHATKYPWLFPSIYSYETAFKRLTDRYTSDLKNLKDKLKENEDAQQGLNKSLNEKNKYLTDCSEKEIQHLVKVITELSEFRTYFKLTLSGITFAFREILGEIASVANLEPNLFYNAYTIKDISNLLVNNESLCPVIVSQRNEYYIYIVKNLKNEITSDKEFSTILKRHFSTDKKSYILGASASAGIVTGIARVLNNSEVKNLTEESLKGKILVTTMTDPSIMPFIRNCLAFVTDEGGLTSHAAIVSRELNIPCIVGTKNGTQIINDGSLIEVNANTGIVNILKKNKNIQEKLPKPKSLNENEDENKLTGSDKNSFDLGKWLSGHKLEFLYRHKYPLLNAELFFYTTKFCNNVLGNHHKNFIFTLSNKELVAYYFLDELKLGKPLSKKLLDDNFFLDHFDGSKSARHNVNIFLRKYEKYIKKIKKSDTDTLKIFQEYWKVYAGVFAYFRTSNPALVDPFIEELRIIINSYRPEDISVDDAIKFLTTPFSGNLITQETEDWSQVLQIPANTEVFKAHILKYPWLFISTYDFNSALSYLEKRYETDHDKIQEIKISQNEFSDEAKEAEIVRNKLYANSEIKRLSTIILTLTVDRLINKCAWTGLDFQVRELFKIMAKKAGISIEDFINSYTYDDVVKLFTFNQILPKDEINKRLLSFTIISDNLNYIFLSGNKSVELNEKINFSEHDGGSIEGISASKGCVVGKVFIVSMKNVSDLQDQLKNFTEGDILVAGMTEPNLVPYMIKSGGIITDQGGLTSHAAIVARELKKPCVVGTKIATQVLKTGDQVELNANTGFIKIIK